MKEKKERNQPDFSGDPPPTNESTIIKTGSIDWQLEHYDRQLAMAVLFSQRSADLLQNCDLPPPLKLYSPIEDDHHDRSSNEDKKRPSILSTSLILPAPEPEKDDDDYDYGLGLDDCSENTRLLRALRLSQSRAREAEKKASLASISNNRMAALLLEESLKSSSHRQWVKLLEIEISLLQQQQQKGMESGEEEESDVEVVPALTWCLTLALCLGLGFALGRYMFCSSLSSGLRGG